MAFRERRDVVSKSEIGDRQEPDSSTVVVAETGRQPKKRRRPSGEPPPLPRHLRSSGKLLLALSGAFFFILLLVALIGFDRWIEHFDFTILNAISRLRADSVTSIMRGIQDVLGSELVIGIARWSTILALLVFKRLRHLLVLLGSILAVGLVTSAITLVFVRARPVGVEILDHWQGGSLPSRPVAALAVTLVGILYTLVAPGKPRDIGKWVVRALLFLLVLARLYLGVDHPTDAVFGLILGITIPLVAFRMLTPNDVFPVTCSRGKAAHLDVEGVRGTAIRRALEQQLGLTVVEMKPFGLAGSGGSTPLRLRVQEHPGVYLFAKLYASSHLRADRWYKLGRTLLYGRLEDEGSFSTVRRLVQYEDYMLRVMRDAGIHVPKSFGFVEISPEREYLLVTEFVDGAKELLDAEVTESVIDGLMQLIRDLWDAGLAHRDVKPSNVLVRDGQVHVIDVAFGEVRPSPWRQAVDLANAMVALAFRSDPEHVYRRALNYFTSDEIAEAFAATRGVTLPSQSKQLLKKDGRALVDAFRKLAPERRPISIQRWSWRRILLTIGVALGAFILLELTVSNLRGAGLINRPSDTSSSYAFVGRLPECNDLHHGDQFALEAQAVPSAALLPCVDAPPQGWNFKAFEIRDGRTRVVAEPGGPSDELMDAILTPSCDTSGATEVPSDEVGARRFEEISDLQGSYSGVRYYVFDGGCFRYEFDFNGEGRTARAEEASLVFGFVPRADVVAVYEDFTGLDF